MTVSPGFFSTGMLSPVSIDSSTAERPSIISPSTGTFSPGRTTTISPITTFSTGISSSRPSLTTLAVLALSPISFFMASEVLPFATASRYLPSIISVITTAEASKYRFIASPAKNPLYTLYR